MINKEVPSDAAVETYRFTKIGRPRRRPLTRSQHSKAAVLVNGIHDQLTALSEVVDGALGQPYQRSLAEYQDRIYRRLFEPLINEWEVRRLQRECTAWLEPDPEAPAMKTFRIMKIDRTNWALLAREGRRDEWRTVSFHNTRKEAKAAEAAAFQREVADLNSDKTRAA